MRWPLGTSCSHSPAWTRLLLTGTLFAFSTCSASLELPSSVSLDPLTEGADAHLPVPRSLDRVLATSWFQGHEVRPEAMIFSPEGLPGPGHTGRETLDAEGSLIIRNVMTLDAGSYMVVLETSRGRRSATEQIPIKATYDRVQLVTFPGNRQGILRSELNYSVILQWAALITPEPVLRWTFNGRPRGTGERLIILRSGRGTHRTCTHLSEPPALPVGRICHCAHRGRICGRLGIGWKHALYLHPEAKVWLTMKR